MVIDADPMETVTGDVRDSGLLENGQESGSSHDVGQRLDRWKNQLESKLTFLRSNRGSDRRSYYVPELHQQ